MCVLLDVLVVATWTRLKGREGEQPQSKQHWALHPRGVESFFTDGAASACACVCVCCMPCSFRFYVYIYTYIYRRVRTHVRVCVSALIFSL